MRARQFYWQWAKRAFLASVEPADLVAMFIALVVGAAASRYPAIGRRMDYLTWLLPALVFVAALTINALRTPYQFYREVEKDRDEWKSRADEVSRRRQTRERLGGFLARLNTVFARPIASDQELEEWRTEANQIINEAIRYISENVGVAEATDFQTVGEGWAVSWSHHYNSAHNAALTNLDRYRENLRGLIQRSPS